MPESECNIPTLIVSPLLALVVRVLATGEETAFGLDWVVGVLAQAFKKMLVPNVAEPYTKNLRLLNRFAIYRDYSSIPLVVCFWTDDIDV